MQRLIEKEDKESTIYYREEFPMEEFPVAQTRSQQLSTQDAYRNNGGWAPGWSSEAHLIHNRGSTNLLNE